MIWNQHIYIYENNLNIAQYVWGKYLNKYDEKPIEGREEYEFPEKAEDFNKIGEENELDSLLAWLTQIKSQFIKIIEEDGGFDKLVGFLNGQNENFHIRLLDLKTRRIYFIYSKKLTEPEFLHVKKDTKYKILEVKDKEEYFETTLTRKDLGSNFEITYSPIKIKKVYYPPEGGKCELELHEGQMIKIDCYYKEGKMYFIKPIEETKIDDIEWAYGYIENANVSIYSNIWTGTLQLIYFKQKNKQKTRFNTFYDEPHGSFEKTSLTSIAIMSHHRSSKSGDFYDKLYYYCSSNGKIKFIDNLENDNIHNLDKETIKKINNIIDKKKKKNQQNYSLSS